MSALGCVAVVQPGRAPTLHQEFSMFIAVLLRNLRTIAADTFALERRLTRRHPFVGS